MRFIDSIRGFAHKHFLPTPHNDYRPTSLSRDVLVAAVTLTCVIEGFLVTTLFIQSKPGDFTAAVIESAIISLTNNERALNNESQLRMDPLLTRAAQAKADDMALKGYFSHVSPSGEQPWKWFEIAGYDYAYAGENLAIRFYDSDAVVAAWMKSPGHRQNILKGQYQDIGIGIASGVYQGEQTTFVVQFFGTTKSALGLKPGVVQAAPQIAVSQNPKPEVKEAAIEPVPPDAQSTAVPAKPTPPAKEPSPETKPQVNAPVTNIDTTVVSREAHTNIPGSIARLLASPQSIALILLSSIMAFLIIAIGLAMLTRIHLRPAHLIINGTAVALFTLLIIGFNSHFLKPALLDGEPAAAIESISHL